MSGFFSSLRRAATAAPAARGTVEKSDMRFSIEPGPGDSGFSQWLSAMKMVAQLPEGIPPEFRRKLWLSLAEKHLASRGVDWSKVERDCFSEWSHPADAELGVQIVKDLHRTGCSLFCGEDGQENQILLKRVLLAYARWNKAVGYCQGFNMLAALILQVTEKCESEALKLMILLVEGVLPESYFADNLRGLSVDMAAFRELLRVRSPRLSRHLDSLQNAAKDGTTSYEPPLTNVFTMQWFLTLFCNCLPQSTVLRVWDLILMEGNEILLRTALAIWGVLSIRIMSVKSADEFYCIMGVLTREILEFDLVDGNALIKSIVEIGPLTELPALRDKYIYNINPWGSSVSTKLDVQQDKQIKLYGRERLALDISALKKQYTKLKHRQRQAHIIFNAAITGQPPPTALPVAMNHLLLGKSALVPARRFGPPKGAVPPARKSPPTSWRNSSLNLSSSSSSSSSDTELCDDPEDDDAALSSGSSSRQLEDDHLAQASDTLGLMKTDNMPGDRDERSDVAHEKIDVDPTSDTCSLAHVEPAPSTIFDTEKDLKLFDFGKYGLHSDSDDDGFDFEKFLETRAACLPPSSLSEELTDESGSEVRKGEATRKNSRRALEIMQENSLILHRILQCQTRLSPSPPTQLQTAEIQGNSNKVIQSEDTFVSDTHSGSSADYTMEDALFRENNSLNLPLHLSTPLYNSADLSYSETLNKESTDSSCDDYSKYYDISCKIDTLKIQRLSDNLTLSENIESRDLNYSVNSLELDDNNICTHSYSAANTSEIDESNSKFDHSDLVVKLDTKAFSSNQAHCSDDYYSSYKSENIMGIGCAFTESNQLSELKRTDYSKIIDASRKLEEKYESLILNSSSCKYKDKDEMLENYNLKLTSSASSESVKNSTVSPKNPLISPRSPSTGRIYNPFPVNISSRQNKDVAVKLGLYKEQK